MCDNVKEKDNTFKCRICGDMISNNLKVIHETKCTSKEKIESFDETSYNFHPMKISSNKTLRTKSNVSKKEDKQLNEKLMILINQKSEILKKELEHNQQEIKELEGKLRIDEKFVHKNREIRKNAFKQISELCLQVKNRSNEEKKEFFEIFSPWMKYSLTETNPYVRSEALKTFYLFNEIFPDNKSNALVKKYSNMTIAKEIDDIVGANSSIITNITEANDLFAALPSRFYELPYITQLNPKLEVIEKLNSNLSVLKEVKDKEKDYYEIYSVINYTIQDSNILVHSEGIKALAHTARLLSSSINPSKLKLLLYSCFDKFRDKKSLVKNELFGLFDSLIKNLCMTLENFILFILQYAITEKNQKSQVPIIKQCLMEYLKYLFKSDNQSIKEKIKNLNDNNYLTFSKNFIEIISNESQSSIKDLCTDLLFIIKSKIKQSGYIFNQMTEKLPNYRKNILISGKNDYNRKDVSAREYKAKLKRIKSNYSFSSSRKNTSVDASRDRSFCNKRKDTISTPKDRNKKKFQAKNKIKIKMQTNSLNNKTNNISGISSIDNSNDTPVEKILKNEKKIKVALTKQPSTVNSTLEINPNSNNNSINKILLGKRKDTVIDHILELNQSDLLDYFKKITNDFLKFINNVTCGKLKEDLSSHFEVIFSIIEKFLDRLGFLFNKKEDIPEEVMKRILKIAIIAPSVSHDEFNKEACKSHLFFFITLLRKYSKSDDQFADFLIENLIRFTKKDLGFNDNICPTPSIIFYLDFFFRELYTNNNSMTKSNVADLIYDTSYLSETQKKIYLEKIDMLKDDSDINIIHINRDNEHNPKDPKDLIHESSLNKGIQNDRQDGKEKRNTPRELIIKNEINISTTFKPSSKNENLQANKIDSELMQKFNYTEMILLIMKLPSYLLNQQIGEISLYVNLETLFKKLNSENKRDFILFLSKSIDNLAMIKASSFQGFFQLLDFLLHLLASEIISNKKQIKDDPLQCQETILRLQQIAEYLMANKEPSELLKILISLLKKYLPKDIKSSIELDSGVILKILAYLFKNELDIKSSRKYEIRDVEILYEINEMFLTNPPSKLCKDLINFQLYHNIYNLLKCLTDIFIKEYKEEVKSMIGNLRQTKKALCKEYIQYIDNNINMS